MRKVYCFFFLIIPIITCAMDNERLLSHCDASGKPIISFVDDQSYLEAYNQEENMTQHEILKPIEVLTYLMDMVELQRKMNDLQTIIVNLQRNTNEQLQELTNLLKFQIFSTRTIFGKNYQQTEADYEEFIRNIVSCNHSESSSSDSEENNSSSGLSNERSTESVLSQHGIFPFSPANYSETDE